MKSRKYAEGGEATQESAQDLVDRIKSAENKADAAIIPNAINKVKKFGSRAMDTASNYLDKAGLANPLEVINESLGGETRSESKARRASTPFKKGGSVSSASKRADGCAIRGKTRA